MFKKCAYPENIRIGIKNYCIIEKDSSLYQTQLKILQSIFEKWICSEYKIYRTQVGFLPSELLKLNIKSLHIDENFSQFINLFKDTIATATAIRFYDLISEIYTYLPLSFIEVFEGKLYYSLIYVLKIMTKQDIHGLINKLPWYWILCAYSMLFTLDEIPNIVNKYTQTIEFPISKNE